MFQKAYYLKNKRPDGTVVVFEVDNDLHNFIMDEFVEQKPIPGVNRDPSAPQITDKSTLGTSIQLPQMWNSLLEEHSTNAKRYTQQEILKNLVKEATMEQVIHELWSGNISIGFYVFNSDHYWVIYTRNDFSLNVDIEYQAYLNEGRISPEQYNSACLAYRGGVLDLNKDTFKKFLALPEVQVCSIEYLKELFFFNTSNYELDQLEQKYQNNLKLNEEEQRLRYSLDARFPLFYTNFNTKQFYHLENDRCHETLCNPDWKGENKNFLSLIPKEYRYWLESEHDYAEILNFNGI